MLKELKEKLDNLPENYAKDIDIVALKALCTVPETEEIVAHVKELVEKLEAKYVNDDEIKNLIPKDEMILEKLVGLLEGKYSTNIDFITLKAMMNLEDSIEKEKAIKIYLNKINTEDEDIKKYFEDKQKKNKINPDMIFVHGGEWTCQIDEKNENAENIEFSTFDIEVSKFLVTEKEWERVGVKKSIKVRSTFGLLYIDSNTTHNLEIKDFYKPVVKISWWDALNYCNKLSEEYGLEPVYIISGEDEFEKLKIKYITGEIVSPENADFSKTEGYRLPTAIEWEWFARGGKKGIADGSFEYTYAGSDSENEVAWTFYKEIKLHDIAGKQANSLGLYDCSGNVDEWCFDTWPGGTLASYGINSITKLIKTPDEQKFRYLRSDTSRVIRGGNNYNSFGGKYYLRTVSDWATNDSEQTSSTVSLRVVRTANPKY